MREDEVAAAEQMLIDFKNQGGVSCIVKLLILFYFFRNREVFGIFYLFS